MKSREYLKILNNKQLDACTDTEGPSLIVAGAGSGKTRVLTSRIAYMISDCNIDPYTILAITFTNKAAKEMNDRLVVACGESAKKVTCKTFHSFCAFILRNEIEALKERKKSFQIIDDDESEALVKEAMVSLNYDIKLVKPKDMASCISLVKSKVKTPEAFGDYMGEKIREAMEVYNASLIKNNLLDFDDLLCVTIELFSKHPEILDRYQDRYRYILVDEFQDTSNIQYELISMLGSRYHNVFIVGDEDQSIYSFRGANIKNIKKFMKDFKGYKEYVLDQNYRSAPEILEIANNLIKNNTSRIEKNLWSDKPRTNGVELKDFDSDKAESRFIVTTIKQGVSSGKYDYKDFAILYRNNYLSRNFENDLIANHIPYHVYSGLSFYKRKEVKDMISYLRLVLDPNDFYSFKRIINTPRRGIGETTLKKIEAELDLNNKDLLLSIKAAPIYLSIKTVLEEFMATIFSLRDNFGNMELKEFFNAVYERSGYKKFIEEIVDEDERATREENIQELLNAIAEVETIGSLEDTLSDFLQNVTLLTELDVETNDSNHVSLITMHSAKGLEYKNVFACGLENDIIPGTHGLDKDDLEEERRLFYVCITRAMEHLYISHAKTRYKYGGMQAESPSIFLKELGINKTEDVQIKTYPSMKERREKNFEVGDFEVGTRVNHDMFGDGVVNGQFEGFYIIKFDKFAAPKKVIINHPFLKKI